MPSLLTHLALGALLAAALLSDHYDWRSLLIVLAVVAFPDLDTILGLWFEGAHRAFLHNIWVIVIPAVILAWDLHVREESFVLDRWGARGVRIAWVSMVALAFAHILLDAFFNGVNLFWPLHDTFYNLNGRLLYSAEQGLVQTFIELDEPEQMTVGTTEEVHFRTGVDPGDHPVREFHLINSGELLIVTVAGFFAAGHRLYAVHWLDR